MKMSARTLLCFFGVFMALATQVLGGNTLTLSGSATINAGASVSFTIVAMVESGVVTQLIASPIGSPNNTVTVVFYSPTGSVLRTDTRPITSILAASTNLEAPYDNSVISVFPYLSNTGFVFTDNSDTPLQYNLHNDGKNFLLLGTPYSPDDTEIETNYGQYNGDSVTNPSLTFVGCYGDYEVGAVGNDKPTHNDDWTSGTYTQRAYPKVVVDDAMTVDLCAHIATAKHFTTFGVEKGRECWFGKDDADQNQRFQPSTDCSVPCSGNTKQKCGGMKGSISLYSTLAGPMQFTR